MAVAMLGIDHVSTPIELRELIWPAWSNVVANAIGKSAQDRIVTLQTCLRSEAYLLNDDPPASLHKLVEAVSARSALRPEEIVQATSLRVGRGGVEHLFSVASGLESAIVGERPILDQVRRSWTVARERGPIDSRLDRLFQHAVATGRKVRRETGIGHATASLAQTATGMVIAGPRPVSGATVTVVGAGAVARSTALALAAHGARRFVVTSRSAESRESLAAALRARGPGCETRSWSALRSAVSAADIVVCATGAPGRVLAADCLPRGRPLIVLDLASPRDVDPAVAMVPGMRLIDLDSIWREARRSHDVPPGEVLKARAIVAGMTDDFMRWLAERHAASVITALRARGDQSSADGLGRGRRLHQQTLALKDIARATAARRGEWTST